MVHSAKLAKDNTIRSMRIISLNVGLPAAQRYEGREVITAGVKKPVDRAVVRFGNLDGDRQADQVNHGGVRRRCASTHSTTTHTGADS
jgi:MOSC domain-containing protein YiiM